ncbi:MAG: hypothetical protein K9I34_06025 [Bacteroidales bacterium]|nr:hypothetical protein [Bacteroidales bacterium]
METQNPMKETIIQILKEKSATKQHVYDQTLDVFKSMKNIMEKLAKEYNELLIQSDSRILFEYKDNGVFEAELKFSGDVLVFMMHTNIFEFNREHNIWKMGYVKENVLNSYCGVIHIYNFLADSFKYQRYEDLGYLVGRIFVNRDKHYFVEGKKQLAFLYNDFGTTVIEENALRSIIETAISYALEFDLLVPPYEHVKLSSVGQVAQKREHSKLITGKRLGFQFNTDDID